MNTPTVKHKKLSPEECKSSVFNRYVALEAARVATGPVDPVILSGCQSMVSLAAMESPEHKIQGFGSRNTLFKYADSVLTEDLMKTPSGEKGVKYLDWLRVRVKIRGEAFQTARTGVERANRAREREDGLALELQELRASVSVMTRAYNQLLKETKNIAEDRATDPLSKLKLANLLDNHFSLFGELFQPKLVAVSEPSNLASTRIHGPV
ncbi:hypothetical protein [Collimonas humicola]|uniref:hypothetical protein n=1 Tax=Collimonas humicola TaxID=2825886 RepID=UPI001B8D6483|nr:hypothetical protein [Collimonas humicola]